MILRRVIPGLLAACLAAGSVCAQPGGTPLEIGSSPAVNEKPKQAEGVDVIENLGAQLPLELPFTTSQGQTVPLGSYFNEGKPVVIAMVYYDCPIVCTVVMDQLTSAFKGMDFAIGDDYTVLFASIDPAEPHTLAASVKEHYLLKYGDATAAEGWAFLTSETDSSQRLAESLGWVYKPIAGGEYSHPVCIFVCTPEGKIARYVYGVGYEPQTMRMALLEASEGKISQSIGDKIMLFCFRYDPTTGKYSLAALRVVQLGGVLSILAVGSLVGVLLVRERVRRGRPGGPQDPNRPSHNPAAGPIS